MTKKKVGVLTFHRPKHSYGAALQAYATVSVINSMGMDAELIDYCNQYEQKEIRLSGLNTIEKLKFLISYGARMLIFGGILDPMRQKKRMNKFYGKVSLHHYSNPNQLDKVEYDVLVAGSDQLWNPQITDGLDEAFLLQHGNSKKRISYATSIGSYSFLEQEKKILSYALSNFDYISVREQYAANALTPLSKKTINVVCDPTLLLNAEKWRQLIQNADVKPPKEIYILTYFVGGNIEQYWDRIKRFVRQKGLKVYNIQAHTKKYRNVDKALCNLMPLELLQYIDHAALVLTDSFHGTAFSINFGKDFVAVLNRKNPSRVENLLKQLNLEDRMDDTIDDIDEPIDFSIANRQLEQIRASSWLWLKNAIDSE